MKFFIPYIAGLVILRLQIKEAIERETPSFASQEYNFDFAILLYDVTTLYFKTFESNELRKTGFSKDNKSPKCKY